MTWIDIVAIVIIVGISFLESHWGFGRALFDMLGLIVGTRICLTLAPVLAEQIHITALTNTNEAAWLGILFGILLVILVFGCRFLSQTVILSLDVLDPILGAILGLVSGGFVLNMLLQITALATEHLPFGDFLVTTYAAKEFLRFEGFFKVLSALTHLGD